MSKVLVIEDDSFLRGVLARKLKEEGFEVLEAKDGEEGLQKAQEESPDMILLDIVLPEMDGFEVLSRLKDNEKSSHIPVIILSNLGQPDERERGLKLGAVAFLIKATLTPQEIVQEVKKYLT